MPKCKGTYFVALKEFVSNRFGEDGWQQFLRALPEADRVVVDQALSSVWVDMQVRLRANRTLVEALGRRDTMVLSEFGRFEAERDLSTTQRMFLRLANSGFAMEKAGQYWRRFYDWGALEVERRSSTTAVATIRESVFADEYYCLQFMAYMGRVFELVGAKGVRIAHTTCRGRGDPACVFEGSWRG